ncbi:DctP family TRAP transporter solute-binding subunit [Glycomyces harbinensis]|uniref:Tripartite ATP-independent transporter solute receptor, DctP family n=1 Tax=Glycomyces harbinensis TaxID=58114 RepID=A0A1G6XJY5_9ACTN|nr:DctP family TRAP transporter solute-binding subunit [Glycomyces harbinensis]SDD78392.1 tripartite ATP-independent transporter solute receptor, DctP family [Glycomyces harbinensis]
MSLTPTARRLAGVAALAVAATAFAACGEDGADDAVTLSFANSYPTSHAHNRCGTELVKEKLEAADVGIEVEIFSDSQLGGDADRFTSVMAGDISMDIQGSSALASSHEPIGVFDMAYAFDGPDHLFEWFDGGDADQLKEDFAAETGAHILDVWYFGMRHFSANDPIRTPADLQGLRMRFPDSPIYLANAEAMGAEATAVAFEEVYLSLQQGVVDGQENPIDTIQSMSFNEVQSHVSLTGHQTGSQMIVVSDAAWQSLSSEQQEALTEAVHETRAENRQCIEDDTEAILDEWRSAGAPTIVEDVDLAAFQAATEAYFLENLEGDQLELYESIRSSAP